MIRLSLSATLLGACVLSAPALAANPPANICVELTAWIDQTNKVAGQKPADPASVPASQAPADPKTATAVEPAKGGGAPAPGREDSPQQDSGLSGPVTSDGPGAAGPQGAAQERAKSAEVNPKAAAQATAAPAPDPKAPPASPEAIEKVRQSAGANDLDACAAVAREMRLAGVALPNPIIALAALKPEIRNTASQGPAPGVPPIPPSGVDTPPAEGASGQPPQPAPAAR
ncbi:MAG: hypothetical protein Q8M31_09465 [Beijerinckiaceae bacterium]|nr:hypothetical protein [Beijerinckiaceae bacterium]